MNGDFVPESASEESEKTTGETAPASSWAEEDGRATGFFESFTKNQWIFFGILGLIIGGLVAALFVLLSVRNPKLTEPDGEENADAEDSEEAETPDSENAEDPEEVVEMTESLTEVLPEKTAEVTDDLEVTAAIPIFGDESVSPETDSAEDSLQT